MTGTTAAKNQARQGDVFVARVEADVKALKPAPKDKRGIVLGEGDSSAHYHVAVGERVRLLLDANGGRVLHAPKGAELRVVGAGSGPGGGTPRHEPIRLAPGAWEVAGQEQWSVEDEASSAVGD